MSALKGLRCCGGTLEGWLLSVRLQFHPMAFAAYALGSLLGAGSWGALQPVRFWCGYGLVFLIELATVHLNEVYDLPSDLRNTNRSPFNGGSGVLVRGMVSPAALVRASLLWLLAAFALAVFLSWKSAGTASGPGWWMIWPYLAVGVLLGPGYTVPPLRLCTRGLGEVDVAFTHSLFLLGLGSMLQSGELLSAHSVLVSLPVFFSVLAAILLAGLPDMQADGAAGKKTLSVLLGPVTVIYMAAASSVLSMLAVIPLFSSGILSLGATAIFLLFGGGHASVLVRALRRLLQRPRSGAAPVDVGRIDAIMQLALSHILWTVGVPLVFLSI